MLSLYIKTSVFLPFDCFLFWQSVVWEQKISEILSAVPGALKPAQFFSETLNLQERVLKVDT